MNIEYFVHLWIGFFGGEVGGVGGALAVSSPVSFLLFAESLFGYSSCEHLPEVEPCT